jgi:hypothetical protein
MTRGHMLLSILAAKLYPARKASAIIISLDDIESIEVTFGTSSIRYTQEQIWSFFESDHKEIDHANKTS